MNRRIPFGPMQPNPLIPGHILARKEMFTQWTTHPRNGGRYGPTLGAMANGVVWRSGKRTQMV